MKLLVTGCQGMLGHDLMCAIEDLGDVIGVDIDDFDITDPVACRKALKQFKPNVVVHAAAYTMVDECESNPGLAMRVNGDGAGNIAEACRETGARMVYFSSDYIFDGRRRTPYSEEDEPAPLSVYGKSKLEGERQVRSVLPEDSLILRTAWLFGLNGRNFVDTMIRLAESRDRLNVVNDQTGCPTWTRHLAGLTVELIGKNASGIFNATNSGQTTWFGLATYVLKKVAPDVKVIPIPTEAYPLPAPRPRFSVLSSRKLKAFLGKSMPSWQEAVDEYLLERQAFIEGGKQ